MSYPPGIVPFLLPCRSWKNDNISNSRYLFCCILKKLVVLNFFCSELWINAGKMGVNTLIFMWKISKVLPFMFWQLPIYRMLPLKNVTNIEIAKFINQAHFKTTTRYVYLSRQFNICIKQHQYLSAIFNEHFKELLNTQIQSNLTR